MNEFFQTFDGLSAMASTSSTDPAFPASPGIKLAIDLRNLLAQAPGGELAYAADAGAVLGGLDAETGARLLSWTPERLGETTLAVQALSGGVELRIGAQVRMSIPLLSEGVLHQTAVGAATATGALRTTAAGGELHLIAVETAGIAAPATPTPAQVKAGLRVDGTAAEHAHSQPAPAPGVQALDAVFGSLNLSRVQHVFAVHETPAGVSDVLTFPPFVCVADPAAWIHPGDKYNEAISFDLARRPGMYQDLAGTVPAHAGDPVRRIAEVLGGTEYAVLVTDPALPPVLRQDAAGRLRLEADPGLEVPTRFVTGAAHFAAAAVTFGWMGIPVAPEGVDHLVRWEPYDVRGVNDFTLEYHSGGVFFTWRNVSGATRGVDVGEPVQPGLPRAILLEQNLLVVDTSGARLIREDGKDVSQQALVYTQACTTTAGRISFAFRGGFFGFFGFEGTIAKGGRDEDLAFYAAAVAGADGLPRPHAGGAGVGRLSAARVAAGEPDVLEVTVNLSAGAWDAATIAIAPARMLPCAVRRGYGRIEVKELLSAHASQAVAVLRLRLSRPVYACEELGLEVGDGCVFDGRGNLCLGNRRFDRTVPAAANGSALPAPALSAAASFGRQSIELSAPRPLSFYALGIPAFDVSDAAGGAVHVVARHPAARRLQGAAVNTTQKNPELSALHALDERQPIGWTAALDVSAVPALAEAGDCFVLSMGNDAPSQTISQAEDPHPNFLLEAMPVHFIEGAASEAELSPGCVLPGPGMARAPARRLPDLKALAASLPAYPREGMAPAMSEIAFYIGRHNQAIYQNNIAEGRRKLAVFGASAGDNYGVDLAGATGAALLAMISDYPAAEKEGVLLWLLHHGYQCYAGFGTPGGKTLTGDGGQFQGCVAMMNFALKLLGMDEALKTAAAEHGGNEVRQPFVWDAAGTAKLAPHDGLSGDDGRKFALSLRRRVENYEIRGETVVGNGFKAPARFTMRDLLLVRERDGATATVLSESVVDGVITITLDQQILGPGDVFHFRAPFPIRVGDADWDIVNNYGYSPSRNASYRSLQAYTGGALACKAVGALNGLEACFAYMMRANGPGAEGISFPSVHGLFQSRDRRLHAFESAMWAAHGAAIAAL